MEITKKQWTIIGIVVAIIAVWYFFLRKKKTESNWGGGIKTPAGTATGQPLPGGFTGRSSGGASTGVGTTVSATINCPQGKNFWCEGIVVNGKPSCRCHNNVGYKTTYTDAV
jgi:hypothetical protein